MKFLDAELRFPSIPAMLFSGILAGIAVWLLYGRTATTTPIVLIVFAGYTAIDAGASLFDSPKAFFVLTGVLSGLILTAWWMLVAS